MTESLSTCFARTEELCTALGYSLKQYPSGQENWLAIGVSAHGRMWTLAVNCDWPSTGSLPSVHVIGHTGFLAHVSDSGWVCVNDSESLSIDLSRHADTVAQTVIAAVSLLTKSAIDAETGHVEFFNELEGYWSNLPSMLLGRTTVEVDERSRLIVSYVHTADDETKVFFLEQSAEPPKEFPKIEGVKNRSLYVHLNEPVLPPADANELTVSYLNTLLPQFDDEQQLLWRFLLGEGAVEELVTLAVSMPRAAGGQSLIGFMFLVKGGHPLPDSPMNSLLMLRHTVGHMRERGGASLEMGSRHVVVIGCGSVGSEVADALASSGVGTLTLVDPDALSADNVFRHALGRSWITFSKTRALRAVLGNRYPGLTVHAEQARGTQWALSNANTEISAIVIAIGMPTLERQLSKTLRTLFVNCPVVHTWLEPLDLGGHAVLVNNGTGCLNCLYRDDDGVDALSSRTSYLAPGQSLTRNLTGCASTFTPYGAIQSRRTALMAAELTLQALGGVRAPRYVYWAGEGQAAAAHELIVSDWWHKAKSNGSLDMSRSMFGTPCRHCRAST